MPKGRPKKAAFIPSPIKIAFLLVQIFLIKIGDIPIRLIKIAWSPVSSIFESSRKQSTSISRRARLASKRASSLVSSLRLRVGKPFSLPPLRSYIKRTRGRPRKFRLSKKVKIILGIGIFAAFLFSYTVFILAAAYQLPNPSKLNMSAQSLTTEFYDRGGSLLYRLYSGNNRSLVKLNEIPKTTVEATIAIEDQNFYHHIGVDFSAILRAFYRNLTQKTQEGASTITQQLIKNSLLTPERSYSRKLREMILALWAERIYSKDEILQMYFNEAPYGGSNIGIAAAAKTYFGKNPAELNLAESAYLAGLPASPTQFSPYGSRPDLVKLRQKTVLERMIEEGYITQKEADEAFAEELKLQPPVNNISAPHFVMYVRNLLAEKYGERVVSQGGLKIYTTLDLKLQEQIEKIVKEELDKLPSLNVQNGAAMVTDVNGQILAMVGSKDYHAPNFGNFNVTLSLRQPGSSIKVITYATAFKTGFSPGNTVLDTPVSFRDGIRAYTPVNYDGRFHGPVSIRVALGSSYNIPAVKMLATVGIEDMIKVAKDLGITTFNDTDRYGLSLTLGGGEVKMIDMMSVYGSLANLGVRKTPTPLLKVTDSNGNVLEEYSPGGKEVLQPQIAYMITDILKDNKARTPAFGASSLLNIPGYEVAVKTGTSDNKRDNWTFGYTPRYVVGVWVGNPDNSPMNPALTSGVTGAAPIWNKIIHTLVDKTEPLAFQRPSGLSEAVVDGRKDLSLAGALPKTPVRIQREENKLIFSDAFSSYATSSAQTAQTTETSAN